MSDRDRCEYHDDGADEAICTCTEVTLRAALAKAEARALDVETYLEELIAECFGIGEGCIEGKRTIDAILEVRRLLARAERLEKALREIADEGSGIHTENCDCCRETARDARAALEGER